MPTNPIREILDNEKKFNETVTVAFNSIDKDRNSQIDSGELGAVMALIAKDMGADPPTSDEVQQVLHNLDKDHSGKLSYDEFKVLIRDVLEAMLEE